MDRWSVLARGWYLGGHLRTGGLGSEGLFVRTVGERVTSESMKHYIRVQDCKGSKELDLF